MIVRKVWKYSARNASFSHLKIRRGVTLLHLAIARISRSPSKVPMAAY
jgi:hypothetical protein